MVKLNLTNRIMIKKKNLLEIKPSKQILLRLNSILNSINSQMIANQHNATKKRKHDSF